MILKEISIMNTDLSSKKIKSLDLLSFMFCLNPLHLEPCCNLSTTRRQLF